MRLYHVPNSSSQRVLWLLEEAGEPYELTILGDRQSRLADPEHMRRHPFGRVPVLEDDGVDIFESGAICLYIADKYPHAGLLPASGTARGLAYQWSLFAYTELQAKLGQVRLASSPEAEQTAREALQEPIDAVAAALQGQDFLVAGTFTVADLLIATVLSIARRLNIGALPPELIHYLDAIKNRPAKQRADARNPPPAAAR
jgi:glutathione S-transferase